MGDSVFLDRHISYLGDCTWISMSGARVQLQPVPVQRLSELERVRLQEVAFNRLLQDYDLGCHITIPRDGQNHKKSLRKKLDSLAKEKNKDKEFVPQAFGIPLWQVIANDRSQKQRQEPPQEGGARDPPDLVSSLLQFATKRPSKEFSSSNSSLGSTPETPSGSTSPNTPETAPRARRRGGMSVDSITDLDDSQSRLLEALQLSLPAGRSSKKEKHSDTKLSLNPIYRQVPRLVDSCCQHLERYGMQTVGIFRVGSSKKRVRQLRAEFDRGLEVVLDEDHSVHDVAALLKEFLRDLPEPLLTRELYMAFINTVLLDQEEQHSALQLLLSLLPPCNSDTLQRLLEFLSTVAARAHSTLNEDGQEITGNKMTSLNLATIFGPNLLRKQKSSDKEFSVQRSARAEESTAIIAVVQRMIASHEALFMVPADLQNEVLMSLLETDPDVVDYLLRRKASQWGSSEMLSSDEAFSLIGRRSSSDSNKASSGELSPYDNSSPVLAERFLQGERTCLGGDLLLHSPKRDGHGRATGPGSAAQTAEDEDMRIWEAWRAAVRSELKHPADTGCHGSVSRCDSCSPPVELSDQPGDRKQPEPWKQTSMGVAECQPHPSGIRNSSAQTDCGRGQLNPDLSPPHKELHYPESSCTEDLPQGSSLPEVPPLVIKPALRNTETPAPHVRDSRMTLTASTQASTLPLPGARTLQPGRGPLLCRSLGSQRQFLQTPAGSTETRDPLRPEWPDWQRDRWQVWQLLSLENTDTLPETLV